jgi:hypothetical protein
MRRPCQMVRVSTSITGAADAKGGAAVVLIASFLCSPATLSAVVPQISQILKTVTKLISNENRYIWTLIRHEAETKNEVESKFQI